MGQVVRKNILEVSNMLITFSKIEICNEKYCFLFQNTPKDLDPSYKRDLDFWDCFEPKQPCLTAEKNRIE